MSDSEEASFASADEGDGVDKGTGTRRKQSESSKSAKLQKVKEDLESEEKNKKESPPAGQGKKPVQKQKAKVQQQKPQGKGNSEAAKKEVGTKTAPAEKKLHEEHKTASEAKALESEDKLGAELKKNESVKESAIPAKSAQITTESLKDTAASQKDVAKVDTKIESQRPPTKEEETQKIHPTSDPDQKSKTAAQADQGGILQAGQVRTNLQSEVSGPEGQDIPRGQRDHTPKQEEILKKLEESAEQNSGGNWGWSSWGSSLLSVASNSVQTFTHQVGDGFTTVLEAVESSLGVPDPEEVAKAKIVTEPEPSTQVTTQPGQGQQLEKTLTVQNSSSANSEAENTEESEVRDSEENREENGKKEESGGEGWFSTWSVAGLAKKVQDTGKTLASKGHTLMAEGFDVVENLAAGGIDVLESIGKKTYNTLSEHDPAFRKTREFLSPKGNKPVLSNVLREARDKAELEAEQAREHEEARKAHFGTLFDDYQGIAHLEALEMLSNQSEKKVHTLLNALASDDLAKIKPTLLAIKEVFEVSRDDGDTPGEQDFSNLVSQCVSELALGTAPDKLNKVHDMVKQWIVDFDSHETHESDSIKEVHQKSIQVLAELTAKGVEQFHKAGELVLLERGKDKDCTERAHSLARLTGVLCHEISNLANKFAEILNKMAGEDEQQVDEVTPLVTNVYLEATNSSTYIQDAFQLLLPVLQHAALEHSIITRQMQS